MALCAIGSSGKRRGEGVFKPLKQNWDAESQSWVGVVSCHWLVLMPPPCQTQGLPQVKPLGSKFPQESPGQASATGAV